MLVVLDDLHWADDATLRTLRHLVSVLPAHARLCLVGSRRSHPEPTGALAEVGEALARRARAPASTSAASTSRSPGPWWSA